MIFDNRTRQNQRIYAHHYRKNFGRVALHKICAWCKRTNVYGQFMFIPHLGYEENQTHGICPECTKKEMANIKEAL
jgi:hypothetical protein